MKEKNLNLKRRETMGHLGFTRMGHHGSNMGHLKIIKIHHRRNMGLLEITTMHHGSNMGLLEITTMDHGGYMVHRVVHPGITIMTVTMVHQCGNMDRLK